MCNDVTQRDYSLHILFVHRSRNRDSIKVWMHLVEESTLTTGSLEVVVVMTTAGYMTHQPIAMLESGLVDQLSLCNRTASLKLHKY